MGFDKLMAPLAGLPVLQRTLDAFLATPEVCEIVLVTPEERFSQLKVTGSTPVSRVDGGVERHFSVLNGLNALQSEATHIAVHDGARPLIAVEQIQHVFESAQETQASTSARRVTETVKRATDDDFVASAVSRDNLWLMETPQIFSKEKLLQAYAEVESQGALVTDEVSALELIGIPTKLIANPTPNPKITFPEDISLAEQLLRD